MKKRLICLMLFPCLAFSQGIRKNFTEMTTVEKNAYVGALNNLANGSDPDIVLDLASNMGNYYYDLTYSSCTQSPFLPFHRMMLWEMENALQRKNPKLTIPYWDWTVNNSPDDTLFTSFLSLDRLPSQWYLSRDIGSSGYLLGSWEVYNLQISSQFCDDVDYNNSYNDLAQYNFTLPADWWVGGNMANQDPTDPLYFLSRAMTDKLWQDWQMTTGATATDLTNMPRYDGGTYGVFVGPLPATDPHDILDSRSMGIFYANNGVANLNGGYQVKNNYNYPEYFSYPNQIIASQFGVPTGKSAVIVSKTNVTLTAGFSVTGGHLEIDVGSGYYDNFPLAKAGAQEKKPFDSKSHPMVHEDKVSIIRSSDGFTARLWLQNSSDVQGIIMGMDGRVVSRLNQNGQMESGYHEIQLDVPRGSSLYYSSFRIGNQTYKQLLPKF